MEKEKKFPEVKTDPNALSDHPNANDLNLRIFNSITGAAIIGVVLNELHDSFLVALPSRLFANKEQRLIEPYMPVKFVRMMKGSIVNMIPCYGEFEAFYIHYLLSEGKEQYPELIKTPFEDQLRGRFEQIKTAIVPPTEGQSVQQEEGPDSIVVPPGSNRYRH